MSRRSRFSLLAAGSGLAAAAALAVTSPALSAGTCLLNEDVKVIASDGADLDVFGSFVNISGDVAIVGGHGNDDNGTDSGSAYILRRIGTVWAEEAKLLASDGSTGDVFGEAVAIRGDLAIIGARGDDTTGLDSGSAYIFRYDGNTWNEEAKLVGLDTAAFDAFGNAVAIDGDVALVGASLDDDLGNICGAVYVFRYNGSTWVEDQKILASDGEEEEEFGFSIAMEGSTAIVGAFRADDNGFHSGAAYILRDNGTTWVEEQKLVASDGEQSDEFGTSVSISGEAVLIGAPFDDDNGVIAGAAYVYRFNGSTWVEEQKLLATDGASGDTFGDSVSISGDNAVIGSPGDDDNGAISGSGYDFRFHHGAWLERGKILASDGSAEEQFGFAISISGSTAVVGVPVDDDNGQDSGSAYLIDMNTPCSTEMICPADPDDFVREFGGLVQGDALNLCVSDDMRLEVRQIARFSPLLPFIRLEYWANSDFSAEPMVSIGYTIECHVSAIAAGGQAPDTLRTSILNYDTGFELVDQRGTGPFADELIEYEQVARPSEFLDAATGEVRVRQDVFDPGSVVTTKWFLRVDLYQVTVTR